MVQSINLIPEQEVKYQQKTQLVKFSTIFSILVLVAVSIASVYYFNEVNNIKSEIAGLKSGVESTRAEIVSLSSIEISARNLDKKVNVLKEIFTGRIYFSKLLREFYARKPEAIIVDSFALGKENTLTVSGVAENYVVIADFTTNLLDRDFGDASPGLQNLFSSVALNSVNLDKQSGNVKYAITVTMDPSGLYEE